MRYSEDHVWVRRESGGYRIGLSDYAQQELGEITFIELPDAGARFDAGDVLCSIDSLKSSSDLYAPCSGVVSDVNSALVLEGGAKRMNEDPIGDGWILILQNVSAEDFDSLMDPDAYREYTGG